MLAAVRPGEANFQSYNYKYIIYLTEACIRTLPKTMRELLPTAEIVSQVCSIFTVNNYAKCILRELLPTYRRCCSAGP